MDACFPPPEEGLRLHLLVQLTPDACADVCRAYLEPLLCSLGRYAPKVDPDLRQTAVHQALISYLNNPKNYDPGRAGLASYLRMAARRDLSNLRRGEQRHHRNRVAWSAVENDEEVGNLHGREVEPVVYLQQREEAEQVQTFLESMKARCTAAEQRVLELMLAGEHRDAVFAEALGVSELSVEEQKREMKRVKDRLKARLKRGGREHG
jgi:RNA polymerase sigma-70 factor (ECF subfamily)